MANPSIEQQFLSLTSDPEAVGKLAVAGERAKFIEAASADSDIVFIARMMNEGHTFYPELGLWCATLCAEVAAAFDLDPEGIEQALRIRQNRLLGNAD